MDFYFGGAIGCFIVFLLCGADEKFYASKAIYRYLALAVFACIFPLTLPLFLYTELVERKDEER